MHEGSLIRRFAAVNGQVANVRAKTEGDDVKLAKFDPTAGDFLRRRDDAAADPLLKGSGRDVPTQKGE